MASRSVSSLRLLLLGMAAALLSLASGRATTADLPVYAPAGPAPNPQLLIAAWPAHWITPADLPATEYGVALFRHRFTLAERPTHFVVHLSADNRYRLFVNGTPICSGPQRSDPVSWSFDSIDLAPHLHAGENLLAVQVWNYGVERPYFLMSLRTGLLVQGDGPAEQVVNSGTTWRTRRDPGYAPIPPDRARLRTFFVAGPGDRLDAAAHPWGWEQPDFNDTGWAAPLALDPGIPAGHGTDLARWLRPRNLPLMAESPQRFAAVRRTNGPTPAPGPDFLAGRAPWVVPPRTKASILLDHGVETNAFPQLVVGGGRGARVSLAYAEALVDATGSKGHRDAIDGRSLVGVEDQFLPDGGASRHFAPLDFRCFRYVELTVETAAEAATIEDLHSIATGYPFSENASFTSDDPSLARVWDTGWRTARLCADETYMDCPYYERLQYIGDTRIQGLVSLYVSGDDRLLRNAIEQFDRSRIPEGLTQSRFPSASAQIISPFSLLWIGLVHDYWRHRDEAAFVAARLRGIENVLAWFADHVEPESGMLGPLPYWTFVDWPEAWPWDEARGTGGEPPGAHTGGSSIVTLQYAMALDQAADLLRANGRTSAADHAAQQAAALRAATLRRCWDEGRRLLADSPEKSSFSQHANALALLSGTVSGPAAQELIERTLADPRIVPCTLYFRFYLLRALKAAGLADRYLTQLGPWHDMLALGLTTFAERPEPTRSDCHAWSASPVYELLATVAGIEPGSPGFRTVRIAPHLGALTHVKTRVPHPAGFIQVELTRTAGGIRAHVELPGPITGEFLWAERSIPLHAGAQDIEL